MTRTCCTACRCSTPCLPSCTTPWPTRGSRSRSA
uniref:Uncharacterized protein n=1 Tax=Arundo donax TaxID=35708 RepID=A0A0A9GYQ1_ARUDO